MSTNTDPRADQRIIEIEARIAEIKATVLGTTSNGVAPDSRADLTAISAEHKSLTAEHTALTNGRNAYPTLLQGNAIVYLMRRDSVVPIRITQAMAMDGLPYGTLIAEWGAPGREMTVGIYPDGSTGS
jgi:hypothetical protein